MIPGHALRRGPLCPGVLGRRGGKGVGSPWPRRVALAVTGALLALGVGGTGVRAAPRRPGDCSRCGGVPARCRPAASVPGVGLPEWTAFEGSGPHDLNLPAEVGGRPLVARWRLSVPGEIVTAPAVVRGVAYFGSLDRCVYAVDVGDGRVLWGVRAPNEVMSEPLVVGSRVFFGVGNKTIVAIDGVWVRGTGESGVEAVSARTGDVLWRFATPGEVMPTLLYRAGVVYAATGNAVFYALAAASGHLLWRVALGSLDSMSSPALASGHAVFGGTTPFRFFGVDLSGRRLGWVRPVPDAAGGVDDISPTVSARGHRVFVQVPYGVFPQVRVAELALSGRSGRLLWQRVLGYGTLPTDGREEVGVATLAAGVLYVGSPALHGLWALSAADGRPVWPRPAALPVGVRASPLVSAHRVLALSSGRLFVLDRADGALLASLRLGVPGNLASCAPPAPERLGDTLLVVGGQEDLLRAIPWRSLPGAASLRRGRGVPA
jgi:outer membrane protein assembly factor BamB